MKVHLADESVPRPVHAILACLAHNLRALLSRGPNRIRINTRSSLFLRLALPTRRNSPCFPNHPRIRTGRPATLSFPTFERNYRKKYSPCSNSSRRELIPLDIKMAGDGTKGFAEFLVTNFVLTILMSLVSSIFCENESVEI